MVATAAVAATVAAEAVAAEAVLQVAEGRRGAIDGAEVSGEERWGQVGSFGVILSTLALGTERRDAETLGKTNPERTAAAPTTIGAVSQVVR